MCCDLDLFLNEILIKLTFKIQFQYLDLSLLFIF